MVPFPISPTVRDECHRLIALQDPDGYLGSYADKTLVAIRDPEATCRVYGWMPVWNLWNRKYAIWGMLAAGRDQKEGEEVLSCVHGFSSRRPFVRSPHSTPVDACCSLFSNPETCGS